MTPTPQTDQYKELESILKRVQVEAMLSEAKATRTHKNTEYPSLEPPIQALIQYIEKQKDKTYQQGYDDCLKEHGFILTKRSGDEQKTKKSCRKRNP